MDEVKEYIDAHPSSALSAGYVFELDSEEQKEYIVKITNDAVYCDSWEAYFLFAHEHQIPISEEVALEAVQSVGLDPLSVPLWLEAIECCPTAERKRELYHLALGIPLYKSDALYRGYKQLEEDEHGVVDFTEANSRDVASLLAKEAPWPDRYTELATEADRVAVRLAWVCCWTA
ncbi:hypothetical protein STCU_06781 [Strigomonas culicis]|uniref:Uncharacterized protein n=1 Tax=Strigomonas culicis TaxID=28005 RepID=S9U8J2_9TRYP|nr:hypothetical protein STCU_06781 [Strigomonas culicis]|eukprot:EPY25223.1 hypothetical protein STCU_06781 [Strigomonas culicis]